MSDDPLMVSQKVLAQLLERSTRRVRVLIDNEGLPVVHPENGGRAQYDLREVIPWWVEYREGLVTPDVVSPLDAARLRNVELEVRKREIELAVIDGDLIRLQDLDEVVDEIGESFRSAVMSLPGTFAGEAVGLRTKKQSVKFLRKLSEHLLAEMRRVAADLREEGESE